MKLNRTKAEVLGYEGWEEIELSNDITFRHIRFLPMLLRLGYLDEREGKDIVCDYYDHPERFCRYHYNYGDAMSEFYQFVNRILNGYYGIYSMLGSCETILKKQT